MEDSKVKEGAMRLLEALGREYKRYEELIGEAGYEMYKSEDDDVMVVSFMKSGTTLTMQMVYQLMCASGKVESDVEGEDFKDINDVLPFIESMHKTGLLKPRHAYSPRCYQTHMYAGEGQFKKEGNRKYIYCVREPQRVAASLFDYILDWMVPEARNEDDQIREEAYRIWTEIFYLEKGDWYEHVRTWLEFSRSGANVLFLIYEDMCKDPEGTVRKVSSFLGLEANNEVVAKVVRKCSREHMVGNTKFDDTTISKIMGWDVKLGNRARAANAKSFKHVRLDEKLVKRYEELYRSCLAVENYDEVKKLCLALNDRENSDATINSSS